MHAVARLVLHPAITNIQTSWVKMGPEGAAAALMAGANDLGGTLMNGTITRSAGAVHGQEMAPRRMAALIAGLGRTPRRTASFAAPPLAPHAKPHQPAGRSASRSDRGSRRRAAGQPVLSFGRTSVATASTCSSWYL